MIKMQSFNNISPMCSANHEYCQSRCTVLLKIKGSCMCSMIGVEMGPGHIESTGH